MRLRFTTVWLLLLAFTLHTHAANWPDWRGPTANGAGGDGTFPEKISDSEALLWKVALPGRGSSTPIVWEHRIVLTTPINGQNGVLCLDREGKRLWQTKLGALAKTKHERGSSTNPSPVTDGRYIAVYFKSGTLAVLDLDGKELWRENLQKRYGEDTLWFDIGTSPVLAAENVIVAVMQGGISYLAAFDLKTGEEAWNTTRMFDCERESDHSYTTPSVVQQGDHEHIVCWGADHLTGHDAANGRWVWSCAGFNPRKKGAWRTIASATVGGNIAVVPYERGRSLAAIKLGGRGDVTGTHWLWKRRLGTDLPTPAIAGDRVYLLNDQGRIACLHLATGEPGWYDELPANPGAFYASPIVAGDRFYAVREEGTVYIGALADDGFTLLDRHNVGESVVATPVPVDGRLLIRGEKHLFCFGTP